MAPFAQPVRTSISLSTSAKVTAPCAETYRSTMTKAIESSPAPCRRSAKKKMGKVGYNKLRFF